MRLTNKIKKYYKKMDCKYLYYKSKFYTYLSNVMCDKMNKLMVKMHKYPSLKRSPYKPDAKALRWSKSNPWFGYDDFLTWKAYRIHDDLVHKEGVNPRSKKYYEEIDKRLYSSYRDRMKRYFSMDN